MTTQLCMRSLNVLADPTRQRIVEMLATGAMSSGDIARRFDVSAPAISQHLRTLRDAKLVRVRAQAQKRFYELDPEGVAELTDWIARIRSFWSEKLDALEEDARRDILDIFVKDLAHTGVIHIGRADARDHLFSRVLHLIKDPTLRRLPTIARPVAA